MKRAILFLLIFLAGISICISCIDFFESDLTDVQVELLAPADSLSTDDKSQRFWWNYIEGASLYELQIVSPDFSEIANIRLDTTLDSNHFQIKLDKGTYHWRVRAKNGSSSTVFSERSLIITE